MLIYVLDLDDDEDKDNHPLNKRWRRLVSTNKNLFACASWSVSTVTTTNVIPKSQYFVPVYVDPTGRRATRDMLIHNHASVSLCIINSIILPVYESIFDS